LMLSHLKWDGHMSEYKELKYRHPLDHVPGPEFDQSRRAGAFPLAYREAKSKPLFLYCTYGHL
jgi:hypothetical protein